MTSTLILVKSVSSGDFCWRVEVASFQKRVTNDETHKILELTNANLFHFKFRT